MHSLESAYGNWLLKVFRVLICSRLHLRWLNSEVRRCGSKFFDLYSSSPSNQRGGNRNVMAASFAIFAQLKPSGDYRRTHDVA